MTDDQSTPSTGRLNEPVTLLFESSPYETLDAIVEHDGKAVYFYLNGNRPGQPSKFGTRACWIRNLELGPYVLNEDEMKQGVPPMLPRTHCVFQEARPVPDPEKLKVVWFEEGNGAALLEVSDSGEETTIGMIPPWSGLEGFHGYAVECANESPLAWPMPENENLDKRVERAGQFWESFEQKPDPFSILQPEMLKTYDQHFDPGKQADKSYFAIDGAQFPPRGMTQYQLDNRVIMLTVAMSLCPQPAVEIFTNDPSTWRRVELGIQLDGNYSEDQLQAIGSELSRVASFPWRNFTWLGPGHTCDFGDAIPNHPFVLLVHDTGMATEPEDLVPLADFREDPVNLLWLVPITAEERSRLETKELTADAIVDQRMNSR